MRNFLLTLLVFASVQGLAQSFKVTKVETSKDHRYQEMNKRLLNKNVKVTFNDNTVTITLAGKNDPLTLRKANYPDNTYDYTEKKGGTTESYKAVFTKTFGVITLLQFSFSKYGSGDKEYNTITAKRF